ncbi:MAG TPA: zinc ribbon domain-containing protein, partial [Actinomycetota bacterium]
MRCPNCQTENPDGARFCSSCGTQLEAPARAEDPNPQPPTPPPAPEPPAPAAPMVPGVPPPSYPRSDVLTAGWGKAILRGVVAFVIMVLVGQVLAFLAVAGQPVGPPIGEVVKGGGVAFYLLHHVNLAADLPTLTLPDTADSPFAGPADLSFTASLALMLGTALFAWLLYRGGRATALAAGGSVWARALHGAKVAVPYAVLALGASFLISYSVDLPPLPFVEGGQPMDVSVAPVGALLWPLVLGAVAGALGGAASAGDDLGTSFRSRFVLGAVSGGWRMTWVGLVLAFAGYLVVTLVHPDVALPFGPEYFRLLFQESTVLDGVLAFVFTLMVVPNIGAAVLVPAMGGALGFFGSVTGVSISCTLLSLTTFPVGEATPVESAVDPCASFPIQFEIAPIGYFAFLLVPVVATILGGRRAARRAEAASASEGAGVGAVAGIVYGLFVAGLILLASIVVGVSGEGGGTAVSGSFSFGPGFAIGTVLALAWGAAGGALGGALAG